MKQLFRCEYCTEVGTEEEILKHEETCIWNYTKRTCYTCRHANRNIMKFTCCAGRDLEEGKYMEGCSSWDRDDRDHTIKNPFGSIFGSGLF
jgi:hypothetical protein